MPSNLACVLDATSWLWQLPNANSVPLIFFHGCLRGGFAPDKKLITYHYLFKVLPAKYLDLADTVDLVDTTRDTLSFGLNHYCIYGKRQQSFFEVLRPCCRLQQPTHWMSLL